MLYYSLCCCLFPKCCWNLISGKESGADAEVGDEGGGEGDEDEMVEEEDEKGEDGEEEEAEN